MRCSIPGVSVATTALCVLVCGIACQRVESAQRSGQPQVSAAARQPQSFEKFATIEFDLPPELAAKASDPSALPAFQVGFFDGPRLARAMELPRSAAKIVGGKVRLDVPLAPVTRPDDASVDIRVRPLSAGTLGPWSEKAGSITLPVLENKRAVRAKRNRNDPSPGDTGRSDRPARRARSRQLAVADIEQHAALKTALSQVIDSGQTLEAAVGSFARVQDLATAVVLAQSHKLAFAKLCAAVDATAQRSLAEGLKMVQPSLDAAEIRKASQEARKLVGRQRPPRPQAR